MLELARSRAGRAVLGLVGLGLVALLIAHTGLEQAAASVWTASVRLPLVFALEGAVAGLDALSLFTLYRERRPPFGQVLRATLIGGTVTALLPAGRTVSEGVKAALLSPFAGGAAAAVAAGRLQASLLLSNGVISIAALA